MKELNELRVLTILHVNIIAFSHRTITRNVQAIGGLYTRF